MLLCSAPDGVDCVDEVSNNIESCLRSFVYHGFHFKRICFKGDINVKQNVDTKHSSILVAVHNAVEASTTEYGIVCTIAEEDFLFIKLL